jgi:hypothetical protein
MAAAAWNKLTFIRGKFSNAYATGEKAAVCGSKGQKLAKNGKSCCRRMLFAAHRRPRSPIQTAGVPNVSYQLGKKSGEVGIQGFVMPLQPGHCRTGLNWIPKPSANPCECSLDPSQLASAAKQVRRWLWYAILQKLKGIVDM